MFFKLFNIYITFVCYNFNKVGELMKTNKIKLLFTFIFSLTTLTGCSFEDLLSDMNNALNNSSNQYVEHENSGNSIELLNNAFNGKVNNKNENLYLDFSNNISNDTFSSSNTKRLSLNKNVKDLEYLDGYTPSTGKVKGLVIPIDFPDYKANQVNYTNTYPSYQSVSSYYYNSSYGNLEFEFDVLDWVTLSHNSSYYENYKSNKYYGDVPGVSLIIEEVFKKIDSIVDFSDYDSNNDGYIDSLHIIYNHPIDTTNADFWWAFQYFKFEDFTVDGVMPYSYVFASYNFLFDDNENCNARTYIHETGHLLGLEDYYDYDNKKGFNQGGLGGADMMDNTAGDHNPFSKISLGWIKNPILVNLNSNETIDITINVFDYNGDTIMICDNYNANKGMFQSYFLIDYYNVKSSLNKNEFKQFNKSGIRLYRVNAELETYEDEYGNYEYFKYDNSYSNYNLIDSIINNSQSGLYSKNIYQTLCAKQADFYLQGDSKSTLKYINSTSSYSFTVLKLTDTTATIRFSKK